jgi:hypothetical protein
MMQIKLFLASDKTVILEIKAVHTAVEVNGMDAV